MNRRNLIRTAGVAGAATAALGAAATSASAAPAVNMAGATTPQDFGAVGDGVADDTTAIQRAIDAQKTKTNKVVYFPPGTYRITRSLVIPDLEGLEANGFNRLVLVGAGVMASRTSIIQVAFAGTAIRCGAPLAAFQGLAFVSGTGPANTVAIHTRREPKPAEVEEGGTDDMDTLIAECTFIDFGTAVKHVGRGLVFINNLVAVGETGLDISWPTSGVKGDGVHLLPYGMRKWLIEGNHSTA